MQSLTVSDDFGLALMESVFGARPPQLDIATTTGHAADDEREGFRLLFTGALLGLRNAHCSAENLPAEFDELLEYLAAL